MTTLTLAAPSPRLAYLLRLGDDQLVLGHRLSEWAGHAPTLEEDIALANIALDHIGAARMLYDRAAEVHGEGLTEDDYAYRRDSRGYRNALLVERPNGDFAHTIARQLFYSAFALPLWQALTASQDDTLAAAAAKGRRKGSAHHVRHLDRAYMVSLCPSRRSGNETRRTAGRQKADCRVATPLWLLDAASLSSVTTSSTR